MARLTVSTKQIRKCQKCGRTQPPLFRHHKGWDGYLGRFNKGIAKNYKRWFHCVDLCLKCHAMIHYLYFRDLFPKWLNRTPRGAKHFRQRLITYCDEWLNGKHNITPFERETWLEFLTDFRNSNNKWMKQRGR